MLHIRRRLPGTAIERLKDESRQMMTEAATFFVINAATHKPFSL
jgi:hypothetical protein